MNALGGDVAEQGNAESPGSDGASPYLELRPCAGALRKTPSDTDNDSARRASSNTDTDTSLLR
jgi:hypothetical protein